MLEPETLISAPVEFEVNGRPCTCPAEWALDPLLDYLRGESGLTGTKDGCRTGECGACMVLVEEPEGWVAVNSCLRSLGQIHGRRVVTVEGVGALVDSTLHPAQEAMIACRAAQCGFCTPGMVMALASHATGQPSPAASNTTSDLHAALSGNLCRCTGYRPIIDAAIQTTTLDSIPRSLGSGRYKASASRLHGEKTRFFSPTKLDELLSLRVQHPAGVLLAGGTDLMNDWNDSGSRPAVVISTRDVTSLGQTANEPDQLRIGASVPLEEVFRMLSSAYPELAEYLRRFASPAINKVATLAGNLQTASPIGDLIPLMSVLGAYVELSSTASTRKLPVSDFYTSYRSTALRPDEVITAVILPHRQPQQHVFAYKVAKRFDQDISTLTVAASLLMADAAVEDAAICFGGMSATNRLASQTEEALIGKPLDSLSIEAACRSLKVEFSPVDDLRGSGGYRHRVAANLLRKLLIDYTGREPTSLWQALPT